MIPGIILFVVGLQMVSLYMIEFISKAFPEWIAVYEELLQRSGLDDAGSSILVVIYAVLVGPIVEELGFRGLTYGYARRALPLWAANCVQAVLFAGMHMNPIQSLYTLCFGLLVGYIYAKCRNIAIPILIHICFNLTSVVAGDFMYLGETPAAFFVILLISLTATYFGFMLILGSIPVAVKVDPEDEWQE